MADVGSYLVTPIADNNNMGIHELKICEAMPMTQVSLTQETSSMIQEISMTQVSLTQETSMTQVSLTGQDVMEGSSDMTADCQNNLSSHDLTNGQLPQCQDMTADLGTVSDCKNSNSKQLGTVSDCKDSNTEHNRCSDYELLLQQHKAHKIKKALEAKLRLQNLQNLKIQRQKTMHRSNSEGSEMGGNPESNYITRSLTLTRSGKVRTDESVEEELRELEKKLKIDLENSLLNTLIRTKRNKHKDRYRHTHGIISSESSSSEVVSGSSEVVSSSSEVVSGSPTTSPNTSIDTQETKSLSSSDGNQCLNSAEFKNHNNLDNNSNEISNSSINNKYDRASLFLTLNNKKLNEISSSNDRPITRKDLYWNKIIRTGDGKNTKITIDSENYDKLSPLSGGGNTPSDTKGVYFYSETPSPTSAPNNWNSSNSPVFGKRGLSCSQSPQSPLSPTLRNKENINSRDCKNCTGRYLIRFIWSFHII